MNQQAKFLRISFILTAIGTMSLLALLTRPALPTIRAVDAVHLVGIGMCFGGAIVSLAAYFRGRRSS